MALGLFIMQSFTKGGQESQATRLTKSDAGLSHAPSTSSMTPPSSLSIHPNRPSSHLFPPQAGHHRCLRRRRRHPSRRTARWGRRPTRARRRSHSSSSSIPRPLPRSRPSVVIVVPQPRVPPPRAIPPSSSPLILFVVVARRRRSSSSLVVVARPTFRINRPIASLASLLLLVASRPLLPRARCIPVVT